MTNRTPTANKAMPGIFHKIINLIPAHTFYYELFAGTSAIAKLLPFSDNKVINDIDPDIYTELKKNYKGGGKILNMDGIPLLRSLVVKKRDSFIFIDLPYLMSTRNKDHKNYKYEINEQDHVEILQATLQLNCNVMIIHPQCELYDKTFAKWYWKDLKIRYHNKTSQERLYMNYPPPTKLHVTDYLGDGRTDRQRIKRKAERFINKLNNLEPLERQYILEKIKELV